MTITAALHGSDDLSGSQCGRRTDDGVEMLIRTYWHTIGNSKYIDIEQITVNFFLNPREFLRQMA